MNLDKDFILYKQVGDKMRRQLAKREVVSRLSSVF